MNKTKLVVAIIVALFCLQYTFIVKHRIRKRSGENESNKQ